jgi:transposase
LVLPFANTEGMSIFLEDVSRRHSEEYIVMFMDQAGWHKAKGLRIPANIELAFLPSYSPDESFTLAMIKVR